MTKAPRQEHPIEYRFDETTYRGVYFTVDGWVTIECSLGSKRTQVGTAPPETLARFVFGEILLAAQEARKI